MSTYDEFTGDPGRAAMLRREVRKVRAGELAAGVANRIKRAARTAWGVIEWFAMLAYTVVAVGIAMAWIVWDDHFGRREPDEDWM